MSLLVSVVISDFDQKQRKWFAHLQAKSAVIRNEKFLSVHGKEFNLSIVFEFTITVYTSKVYSSNREYITVAILLMIEKLINGQHCYYLAVNSVSCLAVSQSLG